MSVKRVFILTTLEQLSIPETWMTNREYTSYHVPLYQKWLSQLHFHGLSRTINHS